MIQILLILLGELRLVAFKIWVYVFKGAFYGFNIVEIA